MNKQVPVSVLAVDLGGTKILVGEVTPEGDVLHTKSYASDTSSQAAALSAIENAIQDYRSTQPLIARELIAVGIGVVGRVDRRQGVWMEIEPGKSVPLDVSTAIEKAIHLPCGIDNDVACATNAERMYGWGKVTDDFVYYNIGTGIAAGVVARGHYIEGKNFNAGEIGHMVVSLDSDVVCGCGRKGCVERIASGLGMHERIVALRPQYEHTSLVIETGKPVPMSHLFEEAQQGDKLSLRIVEEAARAVAASIMNLVRVTDPDTFVLGGSIGCNDYFYEKITAYLNPRTMRFVANGLVKTKLGAGEAGLIGAALTGLAACNSIQRSEANE
ncbi:ROK family protein [Paenibacillaceae bacterium]|nr:ROK family protein [Paenibacillaceae bacterium]